MIHIFMFLYIWNYILVKRFKIELMMHFLLLISLFPAHFVPGFQNKKDVICGFICIGKYLREFFQNWSVSVYGMPCTGLYTCWDTRQHYKDPWPQEDQELLTKHYNWKCAQIPGEVREEIPYSDTGDDDK